MPILISQKAYLDTSHWIALAQRGIDREPFERLVSSGAIVPVLSFAHLSDLAANSDSASRRRMGEYLDRTRRLGQVLWIEGLNTIAADELQAAYERTHLGRRSVQTKSPFSSMLVDSLDYKNHGFPMQREAARRHERELGIGGMIEAVAKSPGRQEYVDFRSTLPSSITRIRDSRGPAKRFSAAECRLFVIDIVEKARLVFSSTADRDRFVDDALESRSSYPALDLRLSYRQGAILTNCPAEPSDAEDYDHLAGIAYCDVAFADKRTIDVIRRGGFARLPRPNSTFSTWLADSNSSPEMQVE